MVAQQSFSQGIQGIEFSAVLFGVSTVLFVTRFALIRIKSKQIANVILLNVCLCVVYVVSSIFVWSYANEVANNSVKLYWNPIEIVPQQTPFLNSSVYFATFLNLPFITFWLIPIANLYYFSRIIREKNRQTTEP